VSEAKVPKGPRIPKVKLGGAGFGGKGLIAGVFGVIVLVAVCAGFFSFSTVVGPREFAIRQVYVGPKAGVGEDVYGPGRHFMVPGYERLHVFTRGIQVLDLNDSELARKREAAIDYYKVAPAIRIQTSEGYQVTVDVTVLYRILDPHAVLTKVGPGSLYEEQVVAKRSDKILRQTLGELNAEEFYNDRVRSTKAEYARQLLSDDLTQWGIQVWGVLIRDYTYDDRYQKAIEERKIQDQTVFKNQAEAVAAEREATKNEVLAEGKAAIDVEGERGRAEVRKINAEAQSYYRKKVAEGDLLVALAEAEGTRLENGALQQNGASQIVGLEMAKALDGTEVIIISTTGPGAVNPLDLDSLIGGW
jgi:regulator of protease activity HflC (stomatin/prohibitin superfamily)